MSMRGAATSSVVEGHAIRDAARAPTHGTVLDKWLQLMFFFAGRAGWLVDGLRPLAPYIVNRVSRQIRTNTALNARRIFGHELADRERRRFAHAVTGSFYDFVADVGRCGRMSKGDLLAQIEHVAGEPAYLAARARRRGAVLVTAHMGSFEVGLAALRQVEANVHVVFKRDAFGGFERLRSRARAVLGVKEAPIDEGYASVIQLRDALLADEVIVMQGDRAMPGQRYEVVPFLSGHLRLPMGPVKLARLTGSPIVPVFVVRGVSGRFTVYLAEPIWVDPDAQRVGGVDPALRAVAKSIESFVGRYPAQWLRFDRPFVEDAEHGE
ncbi:MAG: lysophospholipid acyltransferase family protein [Tepidisphaeraceae bacterium]